MSDAEVVVSDSVTQAAWTAYVAAHDGASLFHELIWHAVLKQAYGLTTLRFGAWLDGQLVGVLPLARVKQFAGKHVLLIFAFRGSCWRLE